MRLRLIKKLDADAFLVSYGSFILSKCEAAGMNFSKPLECKAHSKREKFIPAQCY
jgi:hypothetical protein